MGELKDLWIWIIGVIGTVASVLMHRAITRYDARLDAHDVQISNINIHKLSKQEHAEFKSEVESRFSGIRAELEKQSDKLDDRFNRLESKLDRLIEFKMKGD